MAPRALVVGDDPTLRPLLAHLEPRFDLEIAPAEVALERVVEGEVAVVLVPGDPSAVLRRLAELRPGLPVVALTSGPTEAAAAMRAGAFLAVGRTTDPGVFALLIERAADVAVLRDEVQRLRRKVRLTEGLDPLVGDSPAMRHVHRVLERVADAPTSVLITGESGTGKELVARALHQRSSRRDKPFVAINCAAVPEALLESELFGHVRGAFTDARSTRTGLIVRADGGTLFLDEIGDMPTNLQSKLLRVLQERVVRPLGSEREVRVDVRIVAATHQDLEQLVRAARFRQDLLYRLDVVRIELPPLRERGADVLILAQRFLRENSARLDKEVTGIEPAAARRLLDYDWPGNVRELQNCVERAVLLAEGDQIQLDDLPTKIRRAEPATPAPPADADPLEPLEDVERRHVARVLAAVDGNKVTAARILGIDRKTLYRRLERWQM